MNIINKFFCFFGTNSQKIAYSRKMGVKIGEGCSIIGRFSWGTEPYLIELGDKVRISSGVNFVTHDGGVHVLRNLYEEMKEADKFGKIKIGNNVFIGLNSIIMPGVTIGNNVVIGAGSIVTKDISDGEVVAGIPAKYICSIDEYYNKSAGKIIRSKGLNGSEKKAFILGYFEKI